MEQHLSDVGTKAGNFHQLELRQQQKDTDLIMNVPSDSQQQQPQQEEEQNGSATTSNNYFFQIHSPSNNDSPLELPSSTQVPGSTLPLISESEKDSQVYCSSPIADFTNGAGKNTNGDGISCDFEDDRDAQQQEQKQEEPDQPRQAESKNDGSPNKRGIPFFASLTRYQMMILASAWFGWLFDSFDNIVFVYLAPFCVPSLLGISPASEPDAAKQAIVFYTSVLSSLLLFGWAAGGVIFGFLTDKIGRSKTMMITVLLYSAGTGLCAFSFNIWFLIAFRFISALGVGGEWASGAALVSESVPNDKRVLGGTFLYSAAPFGTLLAYLVTQLFSVTLPVGENLGWRLVFATALIPSIFSVSPPEGSGCKLVRAHRRRPPPTVRPARRRATPPSALHLRTRQRSAAR